MKVLLDHCVPKRFGFVIAGTDRRHFVRTAKTMAWDRLQNGELTRAASTGGFEVMITVDRGIQFEHALDHLTIPIFSLFARSNRLVHVAPFALQVQTLLSGPLEKRVYRIHLDGGIEII